MRAKKNEIKRAVVLALASLGVGVGVMLYCEWRENFTDTFYVCRKMLWVLPIFAVLISLFHYREGKGLSGREYINRLLPFADEQTRNRKVYLDYARILAAIMVILTHACSMQMNENAAAWRTNLLTVCSALGLVCNPLYVMISGALLLSADKEEAIGTFYYRRFIKVVLPMMTYYAIFLCVSGQMSFIPPQNLGTGFLQILSGASGIVPHYWLIYTLISLYITAPFVRVMVRNLNDSQLNALFWIIIGEEIMITYLPLLGIQVGLGLNIAGWEGVFVLGYIITEKRSRMIERTVLLSGILAAVVIPVVLLMDYGMTDYVCNTAPTMVLFAGAIIILLSKIKGTMNNVAARFVRALSQYSYSIILVHWYGLFVVTWGKIGLQPLRFGCVGGIVITVVVAMLVCFVLGFVADNTIVFCVQCFFKGLGEAVKRKNVTTQTESVPPHS